MIDAVPSSIQVITVSFRLRLSAVMTKVDISGKAPSSDTLENINVVEFIGTLASLKVVVERLRVILLLAPITVKLHVNALPVVLHVTSSLSPT